MLVLTRKETQEIMIGDDIKITLVKVKGDRVRVGIDAPRSIRVMRGEILARETEAASDEENLAAAVDALAEVFAEPNNYDGVKLRLRD